MEESREQDVNALVYISVQRDKDTLDKREQEAKVPSLTVVS